MFPPAGVYLKVKSLRDTGIDWKFVKKIIENNKMKGKWMKIYPRKEQTKSISFFMYILI